jgi:hypothetical protein
MRSATTIRRIVMSARLAAMLALLAVGLAVDSAAPGAASAQSRTGPSVSAASPAEVEEERAPVRLTLLGSGFAPGALVRLTHGTLRLDVRPDQVTGDQVTVGVGPEWFESLRRAPPPRTTLPSTLRIIPDHFVVQVVNPDGQASRPAGVRIKRFPVRLVSVGVRQLTAGTWSEVDVSVERRTWSEDIPLVVRAFEKAAPADDREPRIGRGGQVPGVSGAGTIQAGQSTGRVGVWVPSTVAPGEYLFDVIPFLSQVNCPTVLACAVSVPTNVTVLLPTCHPSCPPLPPSGLAIDATTPASIALSWHDQATNEDGFAVERRPPAGTWATVATFGPQGNPPGVSPYMQHTDTGLTPQTTYCYRVKASNAHGAAYSIEACATTGTPPLVAPTKFWLYAANNINVVWYDSTAFETGYELQKAVGPLAVSSFSTLWSTGPMADGQHWTYPDMSTVVGKEYCYRVKVFNASDVAYTEPLCAVAGDYSWPGKGGSSGGSSGGSGGSAPADLAPIGAMWTSVGYWPKVGQAFTIYQNVGNLGETASGSFTDVFDVSYPGGATTSSPKDNGSLASGALTQAGVTFPNGLSAGQHYIVYCADTKLTVPESNEGNNCNYLGLWIGF